jgi:hypothetical protein
VPLHGAVSWVTTQVRENEISKLTEKEKQKRRAAYEMKHWGKRITSDDPKVRGTLGMDVKAQNKLMKKAIKKKAK